MSVKSEKRNSMIDYKEAKKKISIISILRDWGYKFDKSKGKISPNFVLRDEHGKEIDRVIITNPKKSEEQGYWRRDGGKGDLITFIKENLNQFGVVGRNETDTVTKVLAKLMNIEEEKEQKGRRRHLQIPLSKICLKTANWISGSMTTVFVRQRSLIWHNGNDSQGQSISTI